MPTVNTSNTTNPGANPSSTNAADDTNSADPSARARARERLNRTRNQVDTTRAADNASERQTVQGKCPPPPKEYIEAMEIQLRPVMAIVAAAMGLTPRNVIERDIRESERLIEEAASSSSSDPTAP